MAPRVTSIEEARRLLEEERNARAQACYAEVLQVAERCRCRIEVVPYITAEGRVLAQFRVVAV